MIDKEMDCLIAQIYFMPQARVHDREVGHFKK